MAEHEHDPKYRKALGEQLDNAPLPRRKPGAKSGEAKGTEVYRSGAEAPGPVRRVEQQMTYAPGPRGKILSQGYGAKPVPWDELSTPIGKERMGAARPWTPPGRTRKGK